MRFFNGADSSYSGAYVLNALDGKERHDFERAMARSETLRAEVVELSDTAVLLSALTEGPLPSDALRTRVLAQIENTPQEAAAPVPKAVKARRNVRPLLTSLSVGLAATAVVGTVLIASPHPSPENAAVVAISQADDLRGAARETAQGSTLAVSWSVEEGRAYATMRDGYPLPSAKTYELWVTDSDGNTRPVGLITNDATQPQLLSGKIKKGDTIRMTVEPKQGSKYPTTKPIAEIKV